MKNESEAVHFLDDLRNNIPRCAWCGRDPLKKILGLCCSCNETRKRLARLEKLVQEAGGQIDYGLKFELDSARAMKDDCIRSGKLLKGILTGPVSSLSLERDLRRLEKSIAKSTKIFEGMANRLGLIFDPEQRQVLAYFIWRLYTEEASHNRRGRSYRSAARA